MIRMDQQRAIAATGCEVRFDNLTRQLYATDASIYQIEPLGVAFPRSGREASAVIRAAAEAGVSVIPRGAGSRALCRREKNAVVRVRGRE